MKKLILIMGLFSSLFGGKTNGQSADNKYNPKLQDLTSEQIGFIKEKAKSAKSFLVKYSDYNLSKPVDFKQIDKAIENWKTSNLDNNEKPEEVIDLIGAIFGETLVEKLNMEWQLITDEYGTDFTVIHKQYFVNAFPFSSVEKSVLENRPNSLSEIVRIIKEQLKNANDGGDIQKRK